MFFFFKQKTAYEMRISDWSSDVCSSDLRTWEWDYRAGTLRLLPDGALPEADPAHVVKLGFQADADGRHTTHFPRIPARIDGEELQFLFDTGATFRLDEAAAVKLGDASVRQRAGNFITREVLRSEEHTSELQSLMRISYAVFCLNKQHNN